MTAAVNSSALRICESETPNSTPLAASPLKNSRVKRTGAFSAGSLGWLGAILGIVGIILGALGRKDPEKKGIATGGLVCSIIGTVLCVILYVACVACLAAGTAAAAVS